MADPNINASLFKNDRKEQPNQPDFTGPGSVSPDNLKALYEAAVSGKAVFDDRGGIKIRAAGWRKETSSGTAYISLSLQLDRSQVAPEPAPKSADLF